MPVNTVDPNIVAILEHTAKIPDIYYFAIIAGLIFLVIGAFATFLLKNVPGMDQLYVKCSHFEFKASSKFAGSIIAFLGAAVSFGGLWKARPNFTYTNPNGSGLMVSFQGNHDKSATVLTGLEAIKADPESFKKIAKLLQTSSNQGRTAIHLPAKVYETITGFVFNPSALDELSSAGIPFVEMSQKMEDGQNDNTSKVLFVPEPFLNRNLVKSNPDIIKNLTERLKKAHNAGFSLEVQPSSNMKSNANDE